MYVGTTSSHAEVTNFISSPLLKFCPVMLIVEETPFKMYLLEIKLNAVGIFIKKKYDENNNNNNNNNNSIKF